MSEKLKRIRGGHRAFVKRTVNRTLDLIQQMRGRDMSEEDVEVLKAAQITLTEKKETLKKIDEDILEKVGDDEIEQEVFDQSEFCEYITHILVKIDDTLKLVEVDNDRPILDIDVDTPKTPAKSVKAKLPKLTLNKFTGEPVDWQTFWDSFNAAIHSNDDISKIDKFNYLRSLLEDSALAVISGFSLTTENYDAAVDLMKDRFSNPQVIISRHMTALLELPNVTNIEEVSKIRKLYDNIETRLRSLDNLGVASESYGNLLIPVILSKIPDEIKLIISRNCERDKWDVNKVLEVFKTEVDARERCVLIKTSTSKPNDPIKRDESKRHDFAYRSKPSYTASTLFTNKTNYQGPYCSFCGQQHSSSNCDVVTNTINRRSILRKKGKCFLCLRSGHVVRDCPSKYNCFKCHEKHHTSLCDKSSYDSSNRSNANKPNPPNNTNSRPAHAMCVTSSTSVLLQTALAPVGRPDRAQNKAISRIIFDSCSQRTYVSYRLRDKHRLSVIGSDNLLIKTFGDETPRLKSCDLVQLAVATKDGMELYLNAYCIPTICSPISNQVLDIALQKYPHLQGLELADIPTQSDDLEVDVLIGADYYWNFFNGVTRRGETEGPVALQSRLGWILSGPVILTCDNSPACSVNFTSTHVLQIDCSKVPIAGDIDVNLTEGLKKFWDLETIGIRKDEVSVYDQFVEDIHFEEGKYVVALPFKEDHPLLPDNFQISQKRLTNLLRRLQLKPNILHEYNRIIKDQLKEGIIELVEEVTTPTIGSHHYLPHHEVIRLDKDTTKTRLVYDASARVNPLSPSLNDCLYSGPPLTPLIFDILVRFRLNKIAVIADIEKAFLNISIKENHRDFLRFLWVDQPSKPNPKIDIYRFTRVVFGLTSSPFLLNATLRHHLSLFEETDLDFVKDTLKSLYVDDYATGFNCVQTAFEQCKKVKLTLLEGGFNLRKWNSNSSELLNMINNNVEFTESKIVNGFIAEDDQGYTKFTLNQDNGPCPKVLGISWNTQSDEFTFDFKKITPAIETKDITKRLVLSVAAKFYDPIGLLSPIVLNFKLLFKKLCQENLNWDDSLDDELCIKWKSLLTDLQKVNHIPIPRCYCPDLFTDEAEIELHAFGDASENAYGTCIYLRCRHGKEIHCNLIASKTRVAPLTKQTMPRLELLACLISAHLVKSIQKSFDDVLDISRVVYWSDSQVALSWIRNTSKEYKQFVQNRVLEIRRISQIEMWNYCPTALNPADICSRGATPTELIDNQKWWKGPSFMLLPECQWPTQNDPELPVDVDVEVKSSQVSAVTCLATSRKNLNLEEIIAIGTFSRLSKLLRITAFVLRFVRNLKLSRENKLLIRDELSNEELFESEKLWIQHIQTDLKTKPNFGETKKSLNVFEDEFGIFRCRGRMENRLTYETNCPILLPSNHHFTKLVILKAHACVMHNGTQETLAHVRSKYWIVKGRQIVKKILSKCNICKRLEGRSYGVPHAPPLPSFRVSDDFAFSSIGVDYAGPLYVKDIYSDSGDMHKVYIVLYTCASSRALHLDLAPDASSATFVRSLKRFIGRRGVPSFVISDNGKTFKSAELKSFVSSKAITWKYNVELSPWWGGFFERMVRSVKRCLKKTLGTARLTFEELLTLLIEVEGILNSRPLTYVGEEYGEPLTPSHLVVGRRLLSEPNVFIEDRVPKSAADSEMTKRKKYLNTVLSHFWKRWYQEYLTDLREHHRPRYKIGPNVSVGDVVCVHEDKIPRLNWSLARVEKLLPGRDGKIRAAIVRTHNKRGELCEMNRPLPKLFPVELVQDNSD